MNGTSHEEADGERLVKERKWSEKRKRDRRR